MKTKRLLCIILSLAFVCSAVMPAAADNGDGQEPEVTATVPVTADTDAADYRDYMQDAAAPATEKIVLADHTAAPQSLEDGTVLEYRAEIPQDAAYELQLTYQIVGRDNLELALLLDGEQPFAEAAHLEFPGFWRDSDKARRDGAGNEIAPEQVLIDGTMAAVARDYTGVNVLPYRLSLTAGTHTLRLTVGDGQAMLASVALTAPEQTEAYVKPDHPEKNTETVVIEAETPAVKTAFSLIPLSDGSNVTVSPCDPVIGKLNYIGGSNWATPGDTLTWNFKVDKAGYYSFGAQYRQNIELGAMSYRHLTIDGVTPFEEAREMKFTYTASWKYSAFCDENGEPYLFWLDEGPHTLALAATAGPMADAYASLQEATSIMGDLYVDMTMLVGETVDVYRSYELRKQIPQFEERMQTCVDILNEMSDSIEKLQEKTSGSMVSTIDNAVVILQKMLDQPFSAHTYKSSFYTAYTNLGALMGTMTDMPLDLDRLFLCGCDAARPDVGASFFESLTFGWRRFIATFSADYNAVSSSEEDEDGLTLWVNWGRDQAQVLNSLIEEGFAQKTGIGVKINVVNATIIQGILAGKGPDAMLHMARTEPVNLAMRGALVDLTQFEDFDEAIRVFSKDGTTPYQYRGGTYALPDVQSFSMLFVRTDILNDLDLTIPTDWDEFSYVTTTLQRNNLQVYMPQSLFPTMLLQHDLPLYDMEEGISTLTQPEQIRCFIDYTNWYTKYKLPKSMDSFFNRFRIGSTPMGISDYTLLTQLETAAPEIRDRWTVTVLPGVRREDGSLNNLSAGSGSGCAITKLSKNPEGAWKFLKWWTSAETQYAYSTNLESILGPLGRVSTSNLEAFSQLGWSRELLPVLQSQQESVTNLPELPGGYYVSRGIEQAFWNTVEQNVNANDTMLEWGAIVDQEMRRKSAEYSN